MTLRHLALTVALSLSAGSAHDEDSLATAVKASYLTKFAPFVVWPSPQRPAAAFTICVIGKDPFGAILDRAVSGQTYGGRPVVVSRLPAAQADARCEIAFVAGSRIQGAKEALRILRGQPVLTVTDGGGPRGVIDFALLDGRVRFRVDDQLAAADSLTISSKLLSLALAVTPRTDPPKGDAPRVRISTFPGATP